MNGSTLILSDKKEMDGLMNDIKRILSTEGMPALPGDKYSVFHGGESGGTVAAVDGSSSVVMKGPGFIIGAYRSAGVIYRDHSLSDVRFGTPPPFFITKGNMNTLYSEKFADFVGERPRERVRDLEVLLQRLRVIEEMKMVKRLINDLEPGSLILVDGTLRSTVDRLDVFMKTIYEEALAKEITLAGVSKSSTLFLKGMPFIPFVQYMAERELGKKMWYLDVGGGFVSVLEDHRSHLFGKVYIAKLNPRSDYVFRIDVLGESEVDGSVFRNISRYCNDPSYMGYPYPLAKAHNEIVIDRAETEDIRHQIEHNILKGGLGGKQWGYLCQNFHDVLDDGV